MSGAGPRGSIVVFAKVPEAGRVKTRLCPPFMPEQAAHFYAAMLEDILKATERFARGLGLEPVVALDPGTECREWARQAPPGYRVIPQVGVSLSERMEQVVESEAARGQGVVLLRGSDSPALPEARLAEALAALDSHDIAVAPDRDGGYSLIGMTRPWPGLFAHPMSTERVLADTLAQAEGLGARPVVLEPSFDIDRFADLGSLSAIRTLPEAALCPRTFEYLDREGLWPASDGAPGPGGP
ncbi:MAG: TIGR04282 family arsenosugar biosynthesis glycosyltransferase [Myxococcota bacterium]|nr:TIGR04282 family arsenosugar biosynthesis glycosyltransferase [Myxococcota bacterium]